MEEKIEFFDNNNVEKTWKERVKSCISKRSFLIVVFLVVLSFMPVVGIFSIRMPIWGQVIDSVTEKPIAGIGIERSIKVDIGHVAGSNNLYTNYYSEKTDSKGRFFFWPKILLKFPPFFAFVDKDWVNVNMSSSKYESYPQDISPLNANYYQMGYKSGMASFINSPNINYFKINTIELSPNVNDLSECKNNALCIEQNSFDLALKQGNEQLCLNVDSTKEEWDRFNQFKCIDIFAIAKNDVAICDLIDKSYNPKFDYNIKDEKNSCKSSVELYSRGVSEAMGEPVLVNKNEICSFNWSHKRKDLCNKMIERESNNPNITKYNPENYKPLKLDGYKEPTLIDTNRRNVVFGYSYYTPDINYSISYFIYKMTTANEYEYTPDSMVANHKSIYNVNYEKVGICESDGDFAFAGEKDKSDVGELVFKKDMYFHQIYITYWDEDSRVGPPKVLKEKLKEDVLKLARMYCQK